MNTLNFSTLQAFQDFSLACKILFLKACPEHFFRSFSECAGKLVRSKKKSRTKVQRRNSRTVFKKSNLEATNYFTFVAKRVNAHEKKFPPSSLTIGFQMEQFVLVPLSVHNSSNNPTIVTKQELHKIKPQQTAAYHKDTLKRGINQQLSTTASPLVNKILQSPRIKLSNSNTPILAGIETGVLLKDCAKRLMRKNILTPDIYYSLLDAAGIFPDHVANSHAKGKERGA